MRSERESLERAALALAGELARDAIELAAGEPTVVGLKTDALDVVTAADLAIERHFRQRISERFPGHAVLGEEQGLDHRAGGGWTWVVDPIDGTFNYATGLVGASSSLALVHDGETRVGAIADFGLDTVFSARKGAGLTWQGRVGPGDDRLGRARLLIDPGHQVPDPSVFRVLERFAELAPLAPRLVGSAAVSLAAVALSGGCFVGSGLELWDAAAGMLLAEERGRAVRWWRSAADSFHHVLAGEPDLVRAFEPLMPDFVHAWRLRRDGTAPGGLVEDLLGPSHAALAP
jgi:myo-inositol-1(or 4)-monophosphatase